MATSQDLVNADLNLATLDGVATSNADSVNNRLGRPNLTLKGFENRANAKIAGLGFTRIEGATFETGATVPDNSSLLLWATADGGTGFYYYFSGEIPSGGKIVPPDSTPASAGGTGDGGWLVIDDLEQRLAAGAASVGGTTSGQINKRLRKTISADEYGYDHASTAEENKAALKAAVAACGRGFTLLIPETGEICNIDTTLGESDAVLVDKQITIKHHGRMKANYGVLESNPATIFKLAAKGAALTGAGCIYGSGVVDGTNAGDTNTIPSLVLVTADECKISIDFDTPPKTAVNLRNCYRCKVSGGTYKGGLLEYLVEETSPGVFNSLTTAYFAVYAAGGGRHKVFKNDFEPSEAGGRFITCIFSAYSNRNKVFNNTADKPFEKLCYLFGDDNDIHDNQCFGDPGVIPGLETQGYKGTYTTVYRTNGNRNRIRGNYSYQCKGGATFLDGSDNEVTDNTFLLCGQAGVTSLNATDTVNIWSNNKITGNKSTAWDDSGWTLLAGVYVLTEAQDISNWTISRNENIGFGDGTTGEIHGVYVAAVSPYFAREFELKSNQSRNCNHGIKAERVSDSEISINRAENITGWALRDNGSTKNKWLSNTGINIGSIGIENLNSDSVALGNQYNDKSLVGSVSLIASVGTPVVHGGVAANARIFLQPSGNAAGLLPLSKGFPIPALTGGNNFSVLMPNETAPTGGEIFFYRIEQ